MTITIGGLASGIDTDSLITSLVGYARIPIDDIAKKQTNLSNATQTITSISSKLASLKSAALALSDLTGFASYSASSSDTAVVASATGTTSPGSFSVRVTALAREQRTRSDTRTSSSNALGMAGTLGIRVGTGSTVNVAISATDSLTDIATKISSSNSKVNASVMYDGTNYRLLVRGNDSGAANTVAFTESGFVLGLAKPANTYQTAQSAALTVDGIAITSPTNQVTGTIPGVTLALTKTMAAAGTVTIGSDTTALKQKINTFVSAYNDIVNTGHSAAGFGQSKASNPVLAADTSIRTSLNRLSQVFASRIPGGTGAFASLGSIGLKSKTDGTITFDASKFDSAITSDPTSVQRLFVTESSIAATGIMKTFMTTVDSLNLSAGAPIKSRLTTLSTQARVLSKTKTDMESRLVDYENQLRQQFSNMEQQVSKYKAMQAALPPITSS